MRWSHRFCRRWDHVKARLSVDALVTSLSCLCATLTPHRPLNQRRPFFCIYMDFCTGQLPTRKLGSSEQAGTIKRKSVHPRQKSQSLTFSSQSGIHHFRSILFVSGKLLDLDYTREEWIIERRDTDPKRPLMFPETRPNFRGIASWLPLLKAFASENWNCKFFLRLFEISQLPLWLSL